MKTWIIAILGVLVLLGGAKAGWEVIQDSKIRPIIKIELDETSQDILKKVSENTLGLNKLFLDGARNDLNNARQQYYDLWKDEKKFGPDPKIKERQDQLQKDIKNYEKRVKELEDSLKNK